MSRKLRVLVIDDSAYNRDVISKILGEHPDFEVVAKAEDGEQGLKLATQIKPDLITLDVEMPRMDGFTFLRLLMNQMPTPVIVISSHSRKQEVFQALELGALDFVAKPSHYLGEQDDLRDVLISKAEAIQALQAMPFKARAAAGPPPTAAHPSESMAGTKELHRVVAIGASTGGPPALQSVVRALDTGAGTAVLVAQHMPRKFTLAFAERLDRHSRSRVCEGEDGQRIEPDTVYIAPGGEHMEAAWDEDGKPILRVLDGTEADRYRPSVDRLFASVAKVFGEKSLAVVLTGMGSDGAAGVQTIRAHGGRTVAESSESAIVFGMPKEAISTGQVQEVLRLDEIIEYVRAFGRGEHA